MSKKFVDVEALNLRSAPIVDPANRIGILHIGQPVEVLGPDPTNADWLRVAATIDGAAHTGVVKNVVNDEATLRDPVSDSREALAAEAIKEWLRFEKGMGKEDEDPFSGFVGEMWRAIGENFDGDDRDIPWASAAISFMVRNAGRKFEKYNNFSFAASHSTFMHDSIKARDGNDVNRAFWGFKLFERPPQIGDIVCKWRQSTPITYERARRGSGFPGHTDIIVSVRSDHILAIGGNISHSVNIVKYDKTPNGFLAPVNKTFMIMVNNT